VAGDEERLSLPVQYHQEVEPGMSLWPVRAGIHHRAFGVEIQDGVVLI